MHEITETATQSRSADCVQLFEAQAARTPEATAVVFGDAQLSYRELNARANQLARELLRLGTDPDSLVGICLGRSPEMVIAVLATLKAGAAYLPLDPSYPRERLAFMLQDAGASVLLTESSLIEKLPPGGTTVLCLDSD